MKTIKEIFERVTKKRIYFNITRNGRTFTMSNDGRTTDYGDEKMWPEGRTDFYIFLRYLERTGAKVERIVPPEKEP